MTSITIEPTASDAASRSLHVTVPVDRVKAAEDKAVAFYASRARLPGFRPGKAPQAIIRKRFDQAIKQSALEEVIRESWDTARTSQDLKPIADPSFPNLKFEEGSPLKFEFFVEVRPEVRPDESPLDAAGEGFAGRNIRHVQPGAAESLAREIGELRAVRRPRGAAAVQTRCEEPCRR